jgi:CBS domain containing-hemolysin-like protein
MDAASIVSILWKLAVVLLLVLANGYFVAAEFAIVSVRQSRIEALAADGNRRARAVLRVMGDIKSFISACQFGITVASLVLGWLGEKNLAQLIEPALESILPESISSVVAAHTIATFTALAVVTYLHLLLGEFVPKAVALERAERVALAVARPMEIFYKVFKAPIWLINKSGIVTLRLLGLHATDEYSKAYSEEELRSLITLSHKSGHLIADEQQLIHNVFDFTDATVESVMTPRTELEALDANLPLEEMLEQFEQIGYSRMPVYRDSLDNVIGIALHKDLGRLVRRGAQTSIEEFIRPAVFLPTSMRLNDALRSLRRSSAHMALVVDEHGGVEGLVTLEDLIEEIVGDIRDEHDEVAVRQIVEQADGSFTISGRLSIKEANRVLDLGLPESDSYHTIAGFMMARAGRLLRQGESVDYNGLRMTVENITGNRIVEARVERMKDQSAPLPTA